ncbi:MAG: thioredoxin-disulfide reductase [Thaumarchaeota archaeon]|nr:thioredoxin-disulfide reductase [Nitrososphaerota archaeon]MDE1830770.1 thioredoxin-disulfide reductase [Nitrososphaerota archaeon]MDE1840820.1 thioredoxin-disulfide reductase [Nitrososphaerota archaeon]MDE1877004.1 thioredoxin-disulfide reductase [Nitrososphaerota archaeon]
MQAEIRSDDKKPETRKKFDVIIIGAGPAGYTAAIYTSRAKRETLIISGILPGGQLMLTTEVENFPGFASGIMGPELMTTMRQQAERMGTTIIDDEVVNVDFRHRPFKILTYSEEYEADSVIIATGATPRKIGAKGEQEFSARGVSYCATCDGPFFKNQEIVVAGGGDSAMEEAIFLTKFANKIHVIHRKDKLRASKVMQDRAFENQKIQFHWNTIIEEIKGNQKVNQITVKNTTTNKVDTLEVGGIFVAIGHEPNTKLFQGQIDLDANGYIALKNHTQTNVEGVFAAGDVHDHRYRQAITAAAFGCMAAIDVDKYLSEHK